MGLKATIGMLALFGFSMMVITSNILPSWLTSNTPLYQLTIILWYIGLAIGFIKFGFEI